MEAPEEMQLKLDGLIYCTELQTPFFTHILPGNFWVKMVLSGLDLSVTMLTVKHAELRVINSCRAFLNFSLDKTNSPALNSLTNKIYHTLVHHSA